MKITKRLYTGFAIAIFLVVLVGGISYTTLTSQVSEAGWVQHTYKVMNTVKEVQTLVFDMQASRRGYRATNEKRFLGPYNRAKAELPNVLTELKNLIKDNPAQRKRLDTLDGDINTLLLYWDGLELKETTIAEKVAITDREREYFLKIRADFADLIAAEDALLAERDRLNMKSVGQAKLALIAGILLILIVVVSLIFVILNEFQSRRKAQSELKDRLDELKVLNDTATEQNRILTGTGLVNDSLQGAEHIAGLANAILGSLVQYMKVPAGVFYYYDPEKDALELCGESGIATSPRAIFRLNEGLIGAAAAKRDITIINDVPADYWQIGSGTGSKTPDTLMLIPLWLKGQLKGIIELGVFGHETNGHVSLLNAVSRNMAIALNAAYASERVSRLLERVQQQKEELETQQEELRQSNEELTRQAEVLQASEEELKVQEEELRQINAELEEKNEAVEIARQALTLKAKDLEEASRYKSEFLANMSHELRTPLNSILILAKLLADNKWNNLTEKQIEYSRVIHKSGSDLLNLINDILDLSKIEAGKVDMHFEPVPLSQIQVDLDELFRVVAEEKGIQFSAVIDRNAPRAIDTDKQKLEQVLKNLLSNAFKFTPRGGSITAHFGMAADGRVVLSVSDTGIGIPKEKHKLIFEAFQQADGSTSRKYGGTGLGLSICKELIERLGGEIKMDSVEGEGSTFSIYLPVDAERELTDKKEEVQADTSHVSSYRRPLPDENPLHDDRDHIEQGDKTILIIEDDQGFASIVKGVAESKGYKVVVAGAGDEGLLYARKYKPSAILLDIGLPVLDGRSVLKALKADKDLKNIPVHIVTGEDESRLGITGAESYAQKPLAIEDLEHTFDSIGQHIFEQYKRVLFVTKSATATLSISELVKYSQERHLDIALELAEDMESAKAMISKGKYDCIVLDADEDIVKGIEDLKEIKGLVDEEVSIFSYVRRDISSAEELNLKKYSNAVIRRSKFDKDRLMDEMELFLFKVKENEKVSVPRGIVDISDKSLEGRKVLLADDDMRNVFALNTLLDEHGMKVITAGDGKEALELLQQNSDIDIVLMDIMMPEMDGYTAIRHIRSNRANASLPVIALTAKAMAEDREKCIAAGASDYITKPVDNNKLLSLIRVWLSK